MIHVPSRADRRSRWRGGAALGFLGATMIGVLLVLVVIPAGAADDRSLSSQPVALPGSAPVGSSVAPSALPSVWSPRTPAPLVNPLDHAPGGQQRPRPVAFPPAAMPIAPPSNGYGPHSFVVNPYAYYSSEPAPMGITDFGITSSGAGYTYSTSRFLGTMQIRSWTAASAVSIQLNVVVVLTHLSTTTAFWIQDVPFYDTSTHQIDFIDNIWNMSSSSGYLPPGTVQGNGSIYSSPSFYEDDASYSYNGSMVTLSLPVNVSVEAVASTISGITHVGFRYNDGYGWQTYDNVSFPWSTGWTDQGFVVDGTQLNGHGLYDDAEWIIGGPGGGSSTSNQKSNLTFQLEFWNGHNYQAVPNAYNFGSDTAESISNVVETVPSGTSLGPPTAIISAGSSTLHRLYDRTALDILNVTPVTTNGTLWVRGNATNYVGNDVNLTLGPGSYRLLQKEGARTISGTTVSLTAGHYVHVTMPAVTTSPTNASAGTVLNVTGRNFTANGAATVTWSASGPALCTTSISSNGSFNCSVTVPRMASGSYAITATDGSSAATTATAFFLLTTDLRVLGSASASTTDVGLTVTFNASASGGFGPYTYYNWSFGDGLDASSTSPPAAHRYSVSGSYSVIVRVTDSVGSVANSSVPLRVNALPHVAAPSPSAGSADVGQSVTFTARATLGTPPYGAYRWAGLVTGCLPSNNSTVTCTFGTAGTLFPQALVTDSLGVSSPLSVSLSYTVWTGPTVSVPAAIPSSVDLGQSTTFHVSATPGSGTPTYSWIGLPPGCGGTTATVRCIPIQTGTFQVSAAVRDSNGFTVDSTAPLPFSVYPPPQLPSAPTLSRPSTDVWEPVTFSAIAFDGSGGFSYAWAGLPAGCDTVNAPTVTCAPVLEGNYQVNVTATDSNLVSTELAFAFEVLPQLRVAGPVSDANATDLGRPIHLSALAAGGAGGVRYVWSGLPPGCLPSGPTITCTPLTTGGWSVNVNVSDLNGANASGASLHLVVNPAPSIPSVAANPSELIPGATVTLDAQVVGGTPGYTYAWKGLPPGCASANAKKVSCAPSATGTFSVSFGVIDGVGEGANHTLTLTVDPAFLGLPASEGYVLVGAILAIAAVAVTALVVARRKRAGRPPASAARPKGPDRSPGKSP